MNRNTKENQFFNEKFLHKIMKPNNTAFGLTNIP